MRWPASAGARALAIGFAQAVALAPGTSRSGITITAGARLGLTRGAAARFSFLLLAPITFGAVLYEGIDLARTGMPEGALGPFVVGIVAAGVSGFAAIWGMLRYLQTHNYDIFVIYRVTVALIVLGLIATGVQSATFEESKTSTRALPGRVTRDSVGPSISGGRMRSRLTAVLGIAVFLAGACRACSCHLPGAEREDRVRWQRGRRLSSSIR